MNLHENTLLCKYVTEKAKCHIAHNVFLTLTSNFNFRTTPLVVAGQPLCPPNARWPRPKADFLVPLMLFLERLKRFCFNFIKFALEKRIATFQKRYEGIGHIIRYFGQGIF